jgi:hypothetical protein
LSAINIEKRAFPSLTSRIAFDPNFKADICTTKPGNPINVSLQRMTTKLGCGFHPPRRIINCVPNNKIRGAGEPRIERYVSRHPTLEPPIAIERIAIVALWGVALVWTSGCAG